MNKKKELSDTLRRSRLESAVAILLLLGLLGIVPFLTRSHGQSAGETPAPAQIRPIGVVTSTKNPLQIALLHWYNANTTTQFTAGSAPYGVAFDGANIWVA